MSNTVLDETKTSIHDEDHYYWMIASCPEDASDIESILNGIAHLYKAQTITIPPVSDNRTGLVYRNWYCAQCHGVPEKEQIVWPSMWRCEYRIFSLPTVVAFNSSGNSTDEQVSLTDCNPLVFTEPQIFAEKERLHPLRECDSEIIYKCQPPIEANTSSKEYQTLKKKLCQVEPGKARKLHLPEASTKMNTVLSAVTPTLKETTCGVLHLKSIVLTARHLHSFRLHTSRCERNCKEPPCWQKTIYSHPWSCTIIVMPTASREGSKVSRLIAGKKGRSHGIVERIAPIVLLKGCPPWYS